MAKTRARESPDQGRYGPARLLLRLEGPLQAGEEAGRELGLRHLLTDGRHDGGHVALPVGVGLDDEATTAVLPQDLVRPVGLADVGDLARRHPARRRLDQQVLQPLRGALALGQAQDDVEALVAVGHRRDDASVREAAKLLDHRRGLDPVEGGPGVVDPDLQLRDSDLLLDLQVGEPGDLGQCGRAGSLATLRRASRSSPKIFSASSARTPESMWSRRCEIGCPTLTDSGSAESRRRISATTASLPRPVPLSSTSISEEWDALGMLVELGPARAAPDRGDLGDLQEQALGDQADPIALGERDPRVEGRVDRERALIERRQEGPRQVPSGDAGSDHGHRHGGDEQTLVLEGDPEEPGVAALEPAQQGAVVLGQVLEPRQEVVGKHRRQGHRDQQARQDRDYVGLPEGGEEPALDAGQREQRHEHEYDDHRRVDDARANL